MVGAGIRFKPSDLGRLANNMEKENKVQKAEYRKNQSEIESEPVYKEYKNTKSNQAKENNSVKENKVEETVKKENKTQQSKENTNTNKDIKNQDKKKVNESDDFFDSLVY